MEIVYDNGNSSVREDQTMELNITFNDELDDWGRFSSWIRKTSKIVYYLPVGIIIVGLVGNIICAKVIGKIQKKVKGIHLIKYLTAVDMMLLIMFLIDLVTRLSHFNLINILECGMSLFSPIYATVYMFEVYLTVLIAVQRCLIVTIPFKFKRVLRDSVTNKILTGILGFTVLLNIPIWIQSRPRFYWNVMYNMTMIRTGDFYEMISEEANVYITIVIMICRHGLPMVVLVACNITLIISRRRMIRNIQTGDRKSANQLTAIVMAITIMSVIVHGLFIASYIVAELNKKNHFVVLSDRYTNYTLMYARDLAFYINSSTNFIFYCAFGREFRRALFAMFKRRAPRQDALV